MSSRALNPQQFGDYTLEHIPPEMGVSHHAVRATQDGRRVGAMAWNAKGIINVRVDEEHQRKGIATAMWNMAQAARPRPKHSPDRTDAGDAWARSVGGRLPRLN